MTSETGAFARATGILCVGGQVMNGRAVSSESRADDGDFIRRKLKQAANPEVQLVTQPETSGSASNKRPWLAVLLSFLFPGVGHLYLRELLRGIFWFASVFLASQLFVPPKVVPETISITALVEMVRATPLSAKLALTVLTILCMVDAYWLATREQAESAGMVDAQTCPNCGKELDESLDFCHWCTSELDPDVATGESDSH